VNWLEIQANRFAAELLMPTDHLTRDLNSLRRIEKRTVALLAAAYKVSPEAMKIRLTNLGITGPF
jgi:Zn-dependent peptidase ImmA (M78 family)